MYWKGSLTLREKCPYLELFRSAFSRIWTSISPYTIRMPENAEQNNSEYGHFLPSLTVSFLRTNLLKFQKNFQNFLLLNLIFLSIFIQFRKKKPWIGLTTQENNCIFHEKHAIKKQESHNYSNSIVFFGRN